MSLRARVAVIFVAVAVLPLVIAMVVLRPHAAQAGLVATRDMATRLVEASALQVTGVATRLAASDPSALARALESRDAAAAGRWLRDALETQATGQVDIVIVASEDGGVLAVEPPSLALTSEIGMLRPNPATIAVAVRRGEAPSGVLLGTREVRAPGASMPVAGYVVAGLWTDRQLLDRLSLDELRTGAAIVSDERVLATRGGEGKPSLGLAQTGQQGRPLLTIAAQLPGSPASTLLLWTMLDSQQAALCWLLIAGSALLSGLTGWLIAGRLTAPTRRVLLESERSRDELRQSLSRLGQTLSSSLDLSRTLSVVVETAMSSLAADRAVLMLLTPERDALFAKVGRGIGTAVPRLRIGQGLTGWVATTGSPLRLPADAGHAPAPSADEPVSENQLLVPLFGRGRVIGVLSLLRDDGIRPFLQADLDTMINFAAQASVAIENVLLHREAQRLAITDPLTGLWNFRHFQVQADREVESAVRFDRPLSLVIVDLDHFKRVNDGLGHQVGDEVLGEVARRIRDSTRVPDVVARYGGEEFVVLLPGTGESGALATAERIRAAVDSAPVKVEVCGEPGMHLPVTCSAGVSSFPVHGKTLEGLLRAADAAMYMAKTRGRNRVVLAGSDSLREVPWLGAPEAVND